ncbi:MAG: TonB family protein, partial [Chitinivibrionales bacterium]|nr:TonB family protein [Chitinivibrionales bacterium]
MMHFSGWFCPIVVLFFILSSPQTVGTCANAHILGGSTDPKATMITDTNLTVLDTIPKLIVHTDPEYPQQAIRAEIEGTVACDLLVSEEGSVEQVTVTQSAHPLLDSCVTQAAANFHFSPGWIDGQKVAVVLSYEKTFSLQQVCSRIQPITNFSGTVIEEGSKIPVPAAELTIIYRDTTQENTLGLPFHRYLQALSAFGQQHCNGDTVTTYTDSLGRFSLYSLPNGAFTVTIMQPGFAILTTSDTITTNHELIATYKLHSLSPHDYEIIAYGINENSNKETLRRELSQMEMKKIAGLGGDAVKVVQALPGIARPYMGGGEIIIRGSETYDSNYYIDGIQIPLLFHYGYKSTYNSDAIKSVALYP